jgi:AraC-like DNA-binding protein
MARPQKTATLTEEQIEHLAAIGCADDEIASLANLSETQLRRSFGTQLKHGRANLRVRVRRKQIERAESGSDTMLIWLGKVYLNQRETVETQISGPNNGPVQIQTYDYTAAAASLARRPVADSAESEQ